MAATEAVVLETTQSGTHINPRHSNEVESDEIETKRSNEECEPAGQDSAREEKGEGDTQQASSQPDTAAADALVALRHPGLPDGEPNANAPSPQLIDEDVAAGASVSRSVSSSPIPSVSADAQRASAEQDASEAHAWKLIAIGIGDEKRFEELRKRCSLVFRPGSSSSCIFLLDSSAFAPLHDVTQLCTSDTEEEYCGVLRTLRHDDDVAVWVLGDKVAYHYKGKKHSGILFGLSRNARSHRSSAWVSASGRESHVKLPLEQLIIREGVATPAQLHAVVRAAHAPPAPVVPLAPAAPPKRVAAVQAEDHLAAKKQRTKSAPKPRRKTQRRSPRKASVRSSPSPSPPVARQSPSPPAMPHSPPTAHHRPEALHHTSPPSSALVLPAQVITPHRAYQSQPHVPAQSQVGPVVESPPPSPPRLLAPAPSAHELYLRGLIPTARDMDPLVVLWGGQREIQAELRREREARRHEEAEREIEALRHAPPPWLQPR